MIQTIDKERRRGKRLLKIVIAALSVVVIACASYSGYWYYQKTSFEERFESTLQKYGFSPQIISDESGNDFSTALTSPTTAPSPTASFHQIFQRCSHSIQKFLTMQNSSPQNAAMTTAFCACAAHPPTHATALRMRSN